MQAKAIESRSENGDRPSVQAKSSELVLESGSAITRPSVHAKASEVFLGIDRSRGDRPCKVRLVLRRLKAYADIDFPITL